MMELQSKETIVRQRYAAGAKECAEKLCCPVNYEPAYLSVIPQEVIERDYGCGDPSRYLREGETVLDLGSGTGKICFIAAQIVGPNGKVIGVDMTDEMLEVARRNAPIIAQRIGYANVEFRKGRIQDLALDLELLDRKLKDSPITDAASFLAADELAGELRMTRHRQRCYRRGRFQLRPQFGRAEIKTAALRRNFSRSKERRAGSDLGHCER